MRRLGGWRQARGHQRVCPSRQRQQQPSAPLHAAQLSVGSSGTAPPARTCSGCSSCCACLSDTRSQREGCASPVSLSLIPDTSLTFLAISLMSVSSFLILLE